MSDLDSLRDCGHGDDPTSPFFACPPCVRAEHPEPSEPGEEIWHHAFVAAHSGTCHECRFGISPGQRIQAGEVGEHKVYRHEGCG